MAKWTKEELELLYSDLSWADLQKRLPNRSLTSIKLKCFRLGLSGRRAASAIKRKLRELRLMVCPQWSSEEICVLQANYHLPLVELAKQLPTRSLRAIRHKRRRLGLSSKHRTC